MRRRRRRRAGSRVPQPPERGSEVRVRMLLRALEPERARRRRAAEVPVVEREEGKQALRAQGQRMSEPWCRSSKPSSRASVVPPAVGAARASAEAVTRSIPLGGMKAAASVETPPPSRVLLPFAYARPYGIARSKSTKVIAGSVAVRTSPSRYPAVTLALRRVTGAPSSSTSSHVRMTAQISSTPTAARVRCSPEKNVVRVRDPRPQVSVALRPDAQDQHAHALLRRRVHEPSVASRCHPGVTRASRSTSGRGLDVTLRQTSANASTTPGRTASPAQRTQLLDRLVRRALRSCTAAGSSSRERRRRRR